MNSRTLTGLLLIVGTIVVFVGFMPVLGAMGDVDWGDASEMIPAFAENSGVVKALIPVATLGMLMVAAGFAGLNHSMAAGSSAHYMRVGLLLYVIGTTVVIGEGALTIGVAEAASAGKQAVAESLFAGSHAIGSAGEATRLLGFALIGVSIFTQKNLHVALGALMVIVGLIGVGVAVSNYSSPLMGIPFIGGMILTLATGILVIRAKD